MHWETENSIPYVKDIVFEEDASKILKGNALRNTSSTKNTSINILRNTEYKNMAEAMRLEVNDFLECDSYALYLTLKYKIY